ncbi:MAG TPA: alpha-amylase family protein [Opitutaceae bacterium]
MNRREFIVLSGAAVGGLGARSMLGGLAGGGSAVPWHQNLKRVGQVNFNERDPEELDVEAWANYWESLKVDAVLVSVTGIIAFYPTQVPFHRRSRFLGSRDLFGESTAAAKKRGIRVIARTSPDLNWEDATHAHPEWFMRGPEGKFIPASEEPRLFSTCTFTTYFTEHMPAIMREVKARYEIDGIFTNGWPSFNGPPVCYCDECRKLGKPGSIEYWEQYTDRVIALWKLYDGIAKEGDPDALYFANLGSGIRASPNLVKLAGVCQWLNCDNQGRGGEGSPIWGASLQGRVAYGVMKGKTVTNVTGAWSTCGAVRWRNVAKSAAETNSWLNQTVASGMTIWYHWVGGQKGLGEDRRWQATGKAYMDWLSRHDLHFAKVRSVANIAVVMGQRTHLFYTPPGEGGMGQFVDGLYYSLLEGRFLFDFVHEDDLGPGTLSKYSVLILPNVAWLSDAQCAQVRGFAAAGGSVMASFETAMYDEKGRRRQNTGLADLFGIESVGPVDGPRGNGFYACIEGQHEILRGFDDTNWIPGGAYRLPIKAPGPLVLSVVPSYTAYPPELSYAPAEHTDEPAVVVRETGGSRLFYHSGDLERCSWRSGHTDLARLTQNAISWLARGAQPATVEGEGVAELFVWETEPGFAVHVLNYNNPNLHKGWLRRDYAIGPQKVRMTLPVGRQAARVELLRSGRTIGFRQDGALLEFTIPSVGDYEVAAVYA